MNWDIEPHRIFETVTGSRLYGTATPDSDLDLRGVCVPPMEVLLDPFQGFEQADSFPGQDRCIYSLAKFMKLASDANPNVVELLFAPKESWIYYTWHWQTLLENRHLFLSRKAKFTFAGFAHSQLISLQRHRQWFTNPPDHQPTRQEYGLPEMPRISGEGLNHITHLPLDLLDKDFREVAEMELNYSKAQTSWQNFTSWRDNRNPARKETEEKFGYDTKYASHTLRVLTQGIELLDKGTITFPRPEAAWLKAIREGTMPYLTFTTIAQGLEADLDATYETSPLPFGPDRAGLTRLYLELVSQ